MSKFVEQVNLFCDGGCRGNPGPGAIGLLILDTENQERLRHAETIGHTTNNRAEYFALIKGLDLCGNFTRRRVVCFMDSKLIVNQMNGVWRVKIPELRSLFLEVKRQEQLFEKVIYQYVERTNPTMKKVDRLLNQAFEGR